MGSSMHELKTPPTTSQKERTMSFAEFDRYVDEQKLQDNPASVPELFGQWLANLSGSAIIGAPVGEAPEFIAIPDRDE